MKGVRTVGKGTTGVGSCEGGGRVPPQQEKASSASLHKRWSSLCAKGGFPFTEIGCSTTQEQISTSSLLCLCLPLTVTHLFLHCISMESGAGGGSPQQKRKGGQGEGACGII